MPFASPEIQAFATGFPLALLHGIVALALLLAGLAAHAFLSREARLAREGNAAAAVALGGSILCAAAVSKHLCGRPGPFSAERPDCALDLHFHRGAADGNRTRVASLEDWGSAIELRPRVPAERAPRDRQIVSDGVTSSRLQAVGVAPAVRSRRRAPAAAYCRTMSATARVYR